MKKAVCVLLAVSIVFLTSCSITDKTDNKTKNADSNGFFSGLFENGFGGLLEKELVEVKNMDENVFEVLCSAYKEDEAALVTVANVPNSEDEKFALCFLDIKKGEITSSVDLKDCPIKQYGEIEYDADGNVFIINAARKKRVKFTKETNSFGKAEKVQLPSEDELGKKSKFYTNSFSVYDNCIQCTNIIENTSVNAVSFYSEPDAVYINEKEDYYVNSGVDKKIIVNFYDKTNDEYLLRVYDYETQTIINELKPEPIEGMKNAYTTYSSIFGDASLIRVEYSDYDETEDGLGEDEKEPEDLGEVRPDEEETDDEENMIDDAAYNGNFKDIWYIWNYNVNAKNTPFESTRITLDEIKEINKKFCQDIKKKYGINVYIDKVNEFEDQNDKRFGYKFGTAPYSAYITLRYLNAFLDVLPNGFVKEIYTGFDDSVEGLDIYIVKRIKSDEGFTGYANNSMERYYICLDSSGVDSTLIPHEFMHLIEARIDFEYGYLGYFDELWAKNNPKGFEYVGVGNEGDVDFSKYTKYFATSYSMTTPMEDRADMFMGMFSAGLDGEAPYWYQKDTKLAKKAKFLAKSIRKAYPSMQDAEIQPWEKYLN